MALVVLAACCVAADPPAVTARVYGKVVSAGDAEELRFLVLGALADRYVAEHDLHVTTAESDRFIERQQASMRRDREQREQECERLRHALREPGLDTVRRESLEKELSDLERLLAALGGIGPAEAETAEDRAAHQMIAEAFVRQWKINRALYQQYGGRIIFQQGGPEPLDAYRSLLEDAQARGDLVIEEPEIAAAFWRYYRDESIHSFYPPDKPETRRVFDTPWWEVDEP